MNKARVSIAIVSLMLSVVSCGSVMSASDTEPATPWDVVVLGRIAFNLVSQFAPSPVLRYSQVLAGEVPNGQPSGQLAISAIDDRLLPPGGVPIYTSQKDEICFLKNVGGPARTVYRVIDIKEATPENLAAFRGR